MANPFNGFFDNLFSGALSPKGNLGDYSHASKTFVDGNFRLAPKFDHLYHVVLNINPSIDLVNFGAFNNLIKREINLLCSAVDLPSYNINTATINQYNRKKVTQTSVDYQPANMTWIDDNAGISNFLWQSYFNYYYSDASHVSSNGTSPNIKDPAYQREGNKNTGYGSGAVFNNRFGLDRPGKTANFFESIQVFQLHPQDGKPTNTSFTYINPLIDSWDHNSVERSATSFSENRMRFSYESVIMDRNFTQVGVAPNTFGEGRYDTAPSPNSIEGGGASSFFGTGGILAGTSATVQNLQNGNVLGALITGANTFRNAKNLSFNSLATELIGAGEDIVVDAIGNNQFPSNANKNVTDAKSKEF